ncbi:PAS domain S-box-containing protein [Oceanospirillum multiglobuliferum]|uniref:histidine kinase n=1 Tax=Oceanospirillum multiglobuliferum TaxID=64969 RepID=A0A1T4RXQ7_9GAMM|nr:response regulator [Oceanospirillum multiglobuliferum]OPX54593.1 hypothetical protein BTE48_13515 [Oceanospirillum multiglobuliferum]SKA20646.1 PAS domain S-box-containing protein [Oceanospirillum multiglobuliferum]
MSFRIRLLISLILIECAIGGTLYYLHSQTLAQNTKNSIQAQYQSHYQFIDSLIKSHSQQGGLTAPMQRLELALTQLTQGQGDIAYIRVRDQQQSSPIETDKPKLLLEARASYFNGNFKPDTYLSLEKPYYCTTSDLSIGSHRYQVDIALNLRPTVKALRQLEQQHLYTTLGLLAGVALLGLGLFRDYGKGIQALRQAVSAVESGQLGYKIKSEHLGELTPTAEAFNRMSKRLSLISDEQNALYHDLLQKDRRLELILNSTDEGILGLNAQQEVFVANLAALQLLGLETATDIQIDALLPPAAKTALAQLYRHQVPFHLEDSCIFTPNQRFIPVEIRGSQTGSEQEPFTIISLRNLSLEKRIQREVEQQNALKAALMDASINAILLMDNEGNTISFNLSMFNLLNRIKPEQESLDLFDLLHIARVDHESRIETLERHSLINSHLHQQQLITPEGEVLHIEFNIQAFDANGQLYYTLVVSDITQRIQDQQRLEAAIEAADSANIAKSQFLAAMSHEIRTPLNGIHGSISLLKNAPLSTQQLELVQAAELSSDVLMQLINDILDFAKIEAGKMTLESNEISLANIIDEALVIIGPKAQQLSLPIKVSIDPSINRCVLADAGRIRQICLNLLSNAVKFTPKGHIHVELEKLPQSNDQLLYVRLAVTDTGVGISANKQALLFNEFTQANQSDSRRFGGSGLGLVISQRLAKLMGGYIVFSSIEGKGSQFCVYLKCPKTDTTVTNYSPTVLSQSEQPLNEQYRVLLVEDSITNQLIATRMLEALNQQIEVANNGVEALQTLKERPFDLILMDLQMPEMNGYEATQLIRAQVKYQHIPIIAMTANVVTSDKERCFEVGMNDFLPKPVNLSELRRLLLRWLPHNDKTYNHKAKPELSLTDETSEAEGSAVDPATETKDTQTRDTMADIDALSISVIKQMEQDIGLDRCTQMIGIVLKELDHRMQLVLQHQQAQEISAIGEQAHTIKSTSASFGLLQVAELARQLEHDCRYEQGQQHQKLITQLQTLLPASVALLKAYQNQSEDKQGSTIEG